jgi:hypothetical protein
MDTSEDASPLRRYRDIGWREGNHIFPYDDEPLHEMWLKPLNGVARLLAGHPRARFFDARDFMIMDGYLRRSRPTLVLYKHYYTRRYLNLDEQGHAYRYVAPRDVSATSWNGRYVLHADLFAAVDHLRLWELPWLKPGLEQERRNIELHEPWRCRPRPAA